MASTSSNFLRRFLRAFWYRSLLLLCTSACSRGSIPPDKPSLQHTGLDEKLVHLLRFSVPLLSVEQAYATKENLILLDIREQEEYQISHIPGARHIGYKDFTLEKVSEIPKDARIVLYCSVGYRSEKAGEKLLAAGYVQVYNLYGSIFEWAEKGYALQDATEQATTRLHTYNRPWGKWIKTNKIHKIW